MSEWWGVFLMIYGAGAAAVGVVALLADRRRVRVTEPFPLHIRDLRHEWRAPPPRGVIRCRPVMTIEGLVCGICGQGPCNAEVRS